MRRVPLGYKINNRRQAMLVTGVRSLDKVKSNSRLANEMRASNLLRLRICAEIGKEFLENDPLYYDTPEKAPSITLENFPGVLAIYLYHIPDDEENIEKVIVRYKMLQKETGQTDQDISDITEDGVISEQNSKEEDDIYSLNEKKHDLEENSNSEVLMEAHQSEKTDDMEECLMLTFVGEIQFVYSQYSHLYCNFLPLFDFLDGRLRKIDREERKERFPNYGNLQFCADKYYLEEKLNDKQLWILNISEEQLESNRRTESNTQYQMDFFHLQRYGCLKPLTEIGYYPVVKTLNDQPINFNDRRVPVAAATIAPCEIALIQEENTLYGPYKVESRNGQYHAVIPDVKDQIISAYIPKNGEIQSNCVQLNEEITDSTCSYILLEEKCNAELVDKMSVEKLTEIFAEQIKVAVTTPSDLNIATSEYADSQSDPQKAIIWDHRREKLLTLMEDNQRWLEASEDVVAIFVELFSKYGNEESKLEPFLDKILEKPQVLTALPKLSRIRREVEEQEEKLNQLRREEEEIRNRTKAENEQRAELDLSDQIKGLQREKRQLEDAVEELKIIHQLGEDCVTWRGRRDVYQEEANKAKKEAEKSKEEKERIQRLMGREVEETLNKAKSQTADIAFNGMIAEKMLHAAAEWSKMEADKQYKELKVKKEEELSLVSKDELKDYLCSMVQRYRPDYTNNDIINIFICIAQNFITVFSGEPGTGKTSICNIIAHVMGLSSFKNCYENAEADVYCNRYTPISVEKGWTSKRDFIGYYNPLSQKFETANSQFVDGLNILNAEACSTQNSQYPYLVLLDEANLSPMEYYWADFMNICDSDTPLNAISLGDDIQLQIPETLRFTATINNDHTTEILSPRLIDRSAIIILPDVPYRWIEDENLQNTEGIKVVSWKAFSSVFGNVTNNNEMPTDVRNLYERIREKFKTVRIRVSPRTEKAIKNYWSVAQELLESGPELDDTGRLALDYAIAQKLLPKINGSGEEYALFLKELQEMFTAGNLLKCADILGDIIRRGQDSMNYFQFF